MFIKKCLTKEYPQEGEFAGGIIFRRCYGQGAGVGFTQEECKAMWGACNLKDHVMLVHNDVGNGSGSPDDTATADLVTDGAGPATDTVIDTADGPGGDAATAGVASTPIKKGDSVEVWWDGEEKWFKGIITNKKSDNNNTSAWQCRYDDGVTCWHDLEIEKCRRIPPTRERVNRLTLKTLRWRLRHEEVDYHSGAHKPALVELLTDHLSENLPVGAYAAAADTTTEGTTPAEATTAESTTPTGATTTAAVTTPPRSVTTTARPRPGDSVEVWWEDPDGFFPCVIVEQQPDVRDTTASLCLYDDGVER